MSAVRLLDVAAALSVATDLGNGQPHGLAIRVTARALRYSAAATERCAPETILWAGLLRFSGCVATSPEEASFGGDDLALRSALLGTDLADPADAGFHLASGRFVPEGAGPIDLGGFADRGPEIAPRVLGTHCEVAVAFGRRLGVGADVLGALAAYHERFDGLGPAGLRGEAIPHACRLLSVAQGVEAHRALAPDERRALMRGRAGRMYDPAVVDLALRVDAEPLPDAPWDALSRAEGPPRTVPAAEVPELLRVLGDWADLKSPWFHGHSRAVARVATAVARSEGEDAALVSAAAAVHDVGRAGVPNGVWEKAGPLDRLEQERMRTHATHGLSILRTIPGIQAIVRVAAADHERADGSGYPVGLDAPGTARAARLLAAADVWTALREPRPHRPALDRDAAAAVLRAEADAGRLDARAVAATLDAAGLPTPAPDLPAGLSEREAEVLALVARGLTNKEVGGRLGVSPRTVQQHTLRIYRKIGVQTRAAAALYAAEHELL